MNKKKTGLKARIKGYMEDVTIDVFGYEKKVAGNVTAYLESFSKSSGIPVNHIHVRIARPKDKLEAHIYYLDKQVRQVTFGELADFFMGAGANTLFDIEPKINRSILAYLATYAEDNKLPLHGLEIRISKPAAHVMASSYHQGAFVSHIPIKALIKYFKG